MSDAELAEKARALREEAHAFVHATRLGELLTERFGEFTVVGSVDLDLMTEPDIDIYVPFERGDPHRFLEALMPLHSAIAEAGHTVFRATFNDEWTIPRGDYGQGYYWGLKWLTPARTLWKLDLWGWDKEAYPRKLAAHQTLARRLAGERRDVILRLKTQALELVDGDKSVTSWDVYQFLLAGQGESFEQLRAWCRARDSAAAS